ncbi:hypothetical protein KR51_00024520 [Rubidibacter lacunae KORDI 51-2]|uniref:Uncharacterized protein n=1 Tax=Rubidibacter lacunae KORDI 51-2 TaxID=582515 RepID=U5DK93_9CHRO|nr:hypothetical protein KR51_00024520 [Rubidibacter lacunae KORDI 51-2]
MVSDPSHIGSVAIRDYCGKPLEALPWSPLLNFCPDAIERVPLSLLGVFLIRYRDNPAEFKPACALYVGRAERCLRQSLHCQYQGDGNEALVNFVRANPLGIFFQYLCCLDYRFAEAHLLVALDYPLCNIST